MVGLLWRKLRRDLWIARGRMLMMVIAIAVGILGVASILSAYTILNREIRGNYLGTHPASAQLELERVDDSLVEAVRRRPGIAAAEASAAIMSRIEKKPGEWIPLLLFIIPDFKTMGINTFRPESGAWPPPEGTILLEKEAAPLVDAKVGDTRRVQTPNGSKRAVIISGLVHDPGLAPAWQEQIAWGYITPATLAWLGESSLLNLLKIIVKDQPYNTAAIERTVGNLAFWLKQQGYPVETVRIPPPGKHPHQSQMNAIMTLLIIFSLLALILSAILTTTLIGGLLAGQARQIGIMKAIGARTGQIAGVYLLMVVQLGFIAVIIGLPPGIMIGRGFARVIAQLLNIKLYSVTVPVWVNGLLWVTGILTPLLVALGPILRYTKVTVREAISDYGISRKSFGAQGGLDLILGKIRGLDRTFILALRNIFRRPGRLLLTLGLLAAAGGLFITSLNVAKGWQASLQEAASKRHYDLEIRLNRPMPAPELFRRIARINGVQKVESWSLAPAAVGRPDGLDIIRTYPDGGHGSLSIRSMPYGSRMVQTPLISGRRLKREETGVVVLNHMAVSFYPQANLGDSIHLTVDGKPVTLRIVGIVREMLTQATAYVTPETFQQIVGQTGQTNCLRTALKTNRSHLLTEITREIDGILEQTNTSIQLEIPVARLDVALNGHVYLFIFALMFMAAVMAVVGALGLMSTMGNNVVERTREFGVMRAIGGRSATIYRNIISEGIFIGLISFLLAVIISAPLSLVIGRLIGNLSFKLPLPLVISPMAVFIWLGIVIAGSLAASLYPARKASQLTVRETLNYI
ncbi:MAG TPA: FtsX-like permease family protein [Bacillota bacterium]|nr:FtsX-like permease family protein [Bacillota bacterium]